MYIKFLDSKELVKCEIISGQNIVTLKFPDTIIVDTSGFDLYLDADGKYDIGGNDYQKFNTIYRNDEVTMEYNGYQLSDNGSIYEPPIITEDLPEPSLTEEEIIAREKQNKIINLHNQISSLKNELSQTDYIFTKNYELFLVGKITDEYDFEQLHKNRQILRNQINSLEEELTGLQMEKI